MVAGVVDDKAVVVVGAAGCQPAAVNLYLMRHGEAAEAYNDRDRPLTQRGRVEALAAAEGLRARAARVSAIVHSPFVRAQETSAIVARELGVTRVVADERFVPEASVAVAKGVVVGFDDDVLVVAHMPILPRLLELLTGVRMPFMTAGVAHVERDGLSFRLAGLSPPNVH